MIERKLKFRTHSSTPIHADIFQNYCSWLYLLAGQVLLSKNIKKYPHLPDIYITTRCEICLKLTIKTPKRSQFSKYKNGTSIFHDVNKFLNYVSKTMHFQNYLTAWINFWITVHPADERKFSQYFYGTRLIKSFHPVYWNTDNFLFIPLISQTTMIFYIFKEK